MGKRCKWLPVIIGGGDLRKGLIVYGKDLLIVWLKREFDAGQSFTPDDVDKIDTALHFTSRESLKMTIDCLQLMYDKWESKHDGRAKKEKGRADY